MKNEYSVLMSVYAKEKAVFLDRSIESVMSQTVPPTDFVLVCDGPLTEELYDVIAEKQRKYSCFRIVKQEKNMGLGESLRHGLSETKHDIVMRMDSDDVCLPNRAEEQLPFLESFDVVGGWISEFENNEENIIGIRKVPQDYNDIIKFAKKRNPFNHPSVMFNKKAIISAGNYQPLLFFEDYYLWVRLLLSNSKVTNVQKVFVNMRSGYSMRGRRGGKEYRQSIRKLRKFMLENRFINWFEYCVFTFGQIAFSCLPIRLKDHFYRRKLRK